MTISEVRPPPISGGTLLLVDGGDVAVVGDPDRDLVYVVDMVVGVERHAIALAEGDEPGRAVVDAERRVHVLARRGGAVVTIDPDAGAVLDRRPTCARPRGIAYESATDALHVACADGELVSLDAAGGEPWRRVYVAPDLRDVVLTSEGITVTQMRAAHLMLLDEEGAIVDTHSPPSLGGVLGAEVFEPTTAWRTIATPDGDWLMIHQLATQRSLTTSSGDGATGGGDPGGSDGGGDGDYGGGGCGGPVGTLLTLGEGRYATRTSARLEDTVLPVDVAMSDAGTRIAIAVAGRVPDERDEAGVVWVRPDDLAADIEAGCQEPQELPVGPGQYVAVAFDREGRLVALSREPAKLVRIDASGERDRVVHLSGPSRADTGHTLFHRDAGAGIACASCHPEGQDDGHVWRFASLGARHTPSLAVGLEGTEPFHWQGDLEDVHALMDEVHSRRMGGRPQSEPRIEALESWIFSLAVPPPRRDVDEPAVLRGEGLFTSWGCDGCHRGVALDGGIDGVELGVGFRVQVPPLLGVATHPPYMHDGRAADLRSAVVDMLARTERRPATDEQLDDMVAYLESL